MSDSYEQGLEQENARLKQELAQWHCATGVVLPGQAEVALRWHCTRAQQAEDRERTALRERDDLRESWRVAEEALRADIEGVTLERDAAQGEVGALMGVLYDVDKATHDAVVRSGGPAAVVAANGERLRRLEAVAEAARTSRTDGLHLELDAALAALDEVKT